ncbi:MAG TPA: nuclear transport factor 2 family protein [Chitinophagaceae bacterium]|nr:nuclear transport factor 2 family protein [Chitinophagaceae bacterium]
MKQILILLTAIPWISIVINAQSPEDSVKAVVNQLFIAMKNTDASLLKDAFADSAVLQTIRRKPDGTFFVQNEQVSDFASQIGMAKKDSLDERITFETIKIDGPMAVVWTPYQFYYAGKFSHCGVNSFQLVKINGRWKIQYLIDTRRRQDCQ